MWNAAWLAAMMLEIIFASYSAHKGNVAETILYCFSAYCCLQFMKKDGDTNG